MKAGSPTVLKSYVEILRALPLTKNQKLPHPLHLHIVVEEFYQGAILPCCFDKEARLLINIQRVWMSLCNGSVELCRFHLTSVAGREE